uniref:Uncharacterized protein n=1 Tax=Arundo donax TaxID=35708 RepID=A0A0A8Z6C1_ARUDO
MLPSSALARFRFLTHSREGCYEESSKHVSTNTQRCQDSHGRHPHHESFEINCRILNASSCSFHI